MGKRKILTLSDNPLAPSGVAHMTKNMIVALLKTGRYKFVSLGGAIKHANYQPIMTEEWGDNWKIYPVNGYGTQDEVRMILRAEKPSAVYLMTDPRSWTWLWGMENEIRPHCPMVYYHVWDNYPLPSFNRPYYESNDVVVSISQLTNDVVHQVSPGATLYHIPHAVDTDIFKKYPSAEIAKFKKEHFPEYPKNPDRFIFFWNNRNARRKQSGTLLWYFKDFLDLVGHDNAALFMHTEPKDPNGQDLEEIAKELGIESQIILSTKKVLPEVLARMINACDCTINIADNEGFGLSSVEAISSGSPIINTMTGGLQEQITDMDFSLLKSVVGKTKKEKLQLEQETEANWFGVPIWPDAKAVIGSQTVPYIFEDRISKESLIGALKKMYDMSKEEREEMGRKGREHAMKNYNFKDYNERWVKVFDETIEKHGSWPNKLYKPWRFKEIKNEE